MSLAVTLSRRRVDHLCRNVFGHQLVSFIREYRMSSLLGRGLTRDFLPNTILSPWRNYSPLITAVTSVNHTYITIDEILKTRRVSTRRDVLAGCIENTVQSFDSVKRTGFFDSSLKRTVKLHHRDASPPFRSSSEGHPIEDNNKLGCTVHCRGELPWNRRVPFKHVRSFVALGTVCSMTVAV